MTLGQSALFLSFRKQEMVSYFWNLAKKGAENTPVSKRRHWVKGTTQMLESSPVSYNANTAGQMQHTQFFSKLLSPVISKAHNTCSCSCFSLVSFFFLHNKSSFKIAFEDVCYLWYIQIIDWLYVIKLFLTVINHINRFSPWAMCRHLPKDCPSRENVLKTRVLSISNSTSNRAFFSLQNSRCMPMLFFKKYCI